MGLSKRIPGKKIENWMSEWGNQKTYSKSQFKTYAGELWMSLEEFEEALRKEEKGFEIIHREITTQLEDKLERTIDKASFRIQALESALIDTKCRYTSQIENLTMKINDMESQNMNKIKPV